MGRENSNRQGQPPPRKKSRIDTSSTDPRHRGRGYTGGPRGRPHGALNKPKAPKDDQPKLPKKKGRPKGSFNKRPRRALTPQPPTPTNDRSPVDGGSPQPPPPETQHPFVLHPNVLPEAVRTYRTPDEYVPYGYVPAEQTLPARHPHPDDFFTTMFSDPPAASSPYYTSRFSEYDVPVPYFGNHLPSSMSLGGNNNFSINPAALDNRYTPNGLTISNNQSIPNGPNISNNHNNNSSSSSSDDWEARTLGILTSAQSQNWGMPLPEPNHTEEANPLV